MPEVTETEHSKTTLHISGDMKMYIELRLLRDLLTHRRHEIEEAITGTGYLPKTVIGVGTFLLDNEGSLGLLTAKQLVIFEKFLRPILDSPRRHPAPATPAP